MFVAILGVTLRGLLFTITGSSFVAEFSGYWLHRLLHSDAFPSLRRGHLIHHFLIYGPDQSLRADEYKNTTDHRASLGNIGFEWLVPSALILASSWGVLLWFHVSRVYQGVASFHADALADFHVQLFARPHAFAEFLDDPGAAAQDLVRKGAPAPRHPSSLAE
jgi:hypothetical protein